MERRVDILTDVTIRQAIAGLRNRLMHDGDGLYLKTNGKGQASWLWRYSRFGVDKWIGLGPYRPGSARHTSLAQARQKAATQGQVLVSGRDPILDRRVQRIVIQQQERRKKVYQDVAVEYLTRRKEQKRWKQGSRTAEYKQTRLTTYISPVIGQIFVDMIETNQIISIVEPVWNAGLWATADSIIRDIREIIDFAGLKGYRNPDSFNPATWENHLSTYAPTRETEKKHHPSLHYSRMNAFLAELEKRIGVAPKALRFLTFAAGRSCEIIGAIWPEILPLKNKIWKIPKERMKTEKDHWVVLTDPMLEILEGQLAVREGDFIFPGRGGSCLSSGAMRKLVYDMDYKGIITPHGFRATFKSWATAKTDYSESLIERCIAHINKAAKEAGVDPQLEAAYQRDHLIEKRRPIMEDWTKFLLTPCEPEDAAEELAEAAD